MANSKSLLLCWCSLLLLLLAAAAPPALALPLCTDSSE
jgi:hypothetical protein